MKRALWILVGASCVSTVLPAQAADRAPVAVLWMGEADAELGDKIVDDVNAALAKKANARPIDSADDRKILANGGPVAASTAALRAGQEAMAKNQLGEAVAALETSERVLLDEAPFDAVRTHLAEIERMLLQVYDQLGRTADAARAAARLRMTPGTDEENALVARYGGKAPSYGAPLPPVEIVSQPPGAQVYRDLLPIGVTPLAVEGGDRAVDFVDVEAPGYRRAHLALGMGGQVQLVLAKEDRLGVLVDRVREQSPDAPAADVAALGVRVGAARVLAIMPDGPRKVLARWLDVGGKRWSDATLRVDNSGQVAMERLAGYVSPGGEAAGASLAAAPPVDVQPPPKKKKLGIWGKWYTWVAAAGVVGLVVTLLVVQNVGSDKVTVTSMH